MTLFQNLKFASVSFLSLKSKIGYQTIGYSFLFRPYFGLAPLFFDMKELVSRVEHLTVTLLTRGAKILKLEHFGTIFAKIFIEKFLR